MTDHNSDDYQEGLRDGRIKSLERSVMELTADMKKMKQMVYALYGAIALVTFLPEALEFLRNG